MPNKALLREVGEGAGMRSLSREGGMGEGKMRRMNQGAEAFRSISEDDAE